MYLQKLTKNSLSIFDDKKNYLDNIESIPWNQIIHVVFLKSDRYGEVCLFMWF